MNNADEIVRELRENAADDEMEFGYDIHHKHDIADLIESLQADTASYQQVKNALHREGFEDIEVMISRYKQVMFDANDHDIERDERIELLEADLARVTAERDAAVRDIPVAHDKGRCEVCKHKWNDGACKKWPDRSCFEWRGVKGEQE